MSSITEDDLRAMVREAIARRAGGSRPAMPEPDPAVDFARGHASHLRIRLSRGSDEDGGACLIEPVVKCSHCGFCQSFGH